MIDSQASKGMSKGSPLAITPDILSMTMSTRPYSRSAVSLNAVTSSESDTSHRTAFARPPPSSISPATTLAQLDVDVADDELRAATSQSVGGRPADSAAPSRQNCDRSVDVFHRRTISVERDAVDDNAAQYRRGRSRDNCPRPPGQRLLRSCANLAQ